MLTLKRRSLTATAIAGTPYTTACSPNMINLPGAEAKSISVQMVKKDATEGEGEAGQVPREDKGRDPSVLSPGLSIVSVDLPSRQERQ